MQKCLSFLGLVIGVILLASGLTVNAQDKPKYTIKEVMKIAHGGKDKLCGKVASGKASKAEQDQLIEAYVALAANKCPKGDAKDWEAKTKALVEGAKAAVKDAKTGGKLLVAAVNCKACHDLHK